MKTKTVPLKQPNTIEPMLATLVDKPFQDEKYIYEIKWDGYRLIAHVNDNEVRLQSRGAQDYTKKYPAVVQALKEYQRSMILDGEVVYVNDEGKPDFDLLQKVNGQKAPLIYYVFDILWLDGKGLIQFPLTKRKEILKEVIGESDVVKVSDDFEDGLLLFEHAKKAGLEGIIAKQKDSQYIPNDRSRRWCKIKVQQRQEFVIGGWVESEKRDTFRTLLFGAYEGNTLKWIGHAGGGYKEKDMPKILARLKAIEIDQNPFVNEVEYSEGKPHWVKPELIAEIKYDTFTRAGKIRKPAIFMGFREDKKAIQIVKEVVRPRPPVKRTAIESPSESNWPVLDQQKITSEDSLTIDDCTIRIHNVEKQIWKGVTKADLIQYYNTMADYILPFLKNRPLSLHIKHLNVNAPGLYIKDMEGRQPDCADIFTAERRHHKAGKRDVIDYLVCNNRATLLYAINLGCIDLNPWTSTVQEPLYPDYIVIDLDPSDGDFQKAVEVARAAKELFDSQKLKTFPKTSGKTGIHIFIPCSGFDFIQARAIAETLCEEIHMLIPSISTTEITVADRGDRVYVDPNQNDYADTVAAPYSVRPYKVPMVSMPFEWKALGKISNESFTIRNAETGLRPGHFLQVLESKVKKHNDKLLKSYISK